MKDFQVIYRNPGHWDIIQNKNRIYKIRGGPGKYYVIPQKNYEKIKLFNSVQSCMSFICDKLMYELIIADGQDFKIIESWNIL
ncbi:MAG: hypothetical protein ACOC1K_01245 [Nanoarchaeota archaeon]